MRALIDTNVLVSYLLNPYDEGAVRTIIDAFLDGRFLLLVPQRLIDEFRTTIINKPRLAKRITLADLEDLAEILIEYGELIEEIREQIPQVARDPKDDYLLAYATVGGADYLVTGDKDLLVLNDQIQGLAILTPAQFAALLA
ncbi:MAG: putative toxin-antitoxin system toxin component, PIN family [Candidatus Promineofilum sp.]|nr:putative toxin-antitoxin system toxin component, PIN family [Promineifilum sp.]MCW5862235.1 putative toxin-antitoxin system toxin component, PIN family [Anaerolineae bacterium]